MSAQGDRGAMTELEFGAIEELSTLGNVIPVHRTILADLLTPAAAFLRVAQGRRRVFLLESVEGGERLGRYSFIGWDPFVVIRGRGNSITVEELGEQREVEGNPFQVLRDFSAAFRLAPVPDLPPFI